MDKLKILLAKGRIYDCVQKLLDDVGISINLPERTYFPITNQADLSFQVVKPQIVGTLLEAGKADVGFSGKDWIVESGKEEDVTEVLDLGFDAVRIVAAIPEDIDETVLFAGDKVITVATEYETLSKLWLEKKNIKGTVFRTWGTSEGFVQNTSDSFAQILIDNTSTGSSLKANRLKVIDTLMTSSTRFYASKSAWKDTAKKQKIMELKMLFQTVLNARSKVMLEMNVATDKLDTLVQGLPSMRSPTVSPLFGNNGYAIKIAVSKSEVPILLPKLHGLGATDIVEYSLRKVML